MLDFGLYSFYVLLVIAVLATIAFPIFTAVKHPKSALGSLIGLGILAVVFGISWALSDSDVTVKQMALGVNETTSKLIGAGLIMFYVTLFLSMIALIYSEISKALK
jgi:hypothetical protein